MCNFLLMIIHFIFLLKFIHFVFVLHTGKYHWQVAYYNDQQQQYYNQQLVRLDEQQINDHLFHWDGMGLVGQTFLSSCWREQKIESTITSLNSCSPAALIPTTHAFVLLPLILEWWFSYCIICDLDTSWRHLIGDNILNSEPVPLR